MKWTVMQLNRFVNRTMEVKGDIDLTPYWEKDKDILRMDTCFIDGMMNVADEKYIFDFELSTTLYMECAITVEEVPVEININVKEIFSYDEEDNEIDGITIDLDSIVWLNILAHKPMRVVKKGVESTFESEEDFNSKQEEAINPAFKDLMKYL